MTDTLSGNGSPDAAQDSAAYPASTSFQGSTVDGLWIFSEALIKPYYDHRLALFYPEQQHPMNGVVRVRRIVEVRNTLC
jgi:hypothetical protein